MGAADGNLIELGLPSAKDAGPIGAGASPRQWRGALAAVTVALLALLSGAASTTGHPGPPAGLPLPYGSGRVVGDLAVIATGEMIEAVELPGLAVRWRRPFAFGSMIATTTGEVAVFSYATGRPGERGSIGSKAFDLVTGVPRWEAPGQLVGEHRGVASFLEASSLVALDMATGARLWVAAAPDGHTLLDRRRPDDDFVLVTPGNMVQRIDAGTGVITTLPGRIGTKIFSGYVEDGVLVANTDNSFQLGVAPMAIAFDLSTLAELWRRPLDREIGNDASPLGSMVTFRRSRAIEAVDRRTGMSVWRRDAQPEALVQLNPDETVLVARELGPDGLPGPSRLFRAADGAALATLDLWRVVGTHRGQLLVIREAADELLRTWLGWVDLSTGAIVPIVRLDGLVPGASCLIDGDWLLCTVGAARSMLVFRL